MIVVTGGAGFIGSALVWALNCRNRSNILIVDHLGESEKWRNLVPLSYIDYIEKDSFLQAMSSDALPDNITSVIHLGACTDPLEKNKSYLTESNFKFSQALASYCLNKHIRFIYASSAITYGKGQASLNDSEEKIEELLLDAGIIRNKLKVRSAVSNANAFMKVQEEFGSFSDYIWRFVDGTPIDNKRKTLQEVPATTPLSDVISKDLKKRGFKFVGSTVVYAHIQATGMVNDHVADCWTKKN